MRNELETTTNRWVYNRLYKEANASCSYCRWHKGENSRDKHYGWWLNPIIFKKGFTHPSWKLVSKNEKQWMKKPVKTRKSKFHNYVEFYW